VTYWNPWLVVAGIVVALVALSPPVEELAGDLFYAHMIQHLILLFVVPPLLVAGWPRSLRLPTVLTIPLVVWILQTVALWAWHLPSLYDAAIANPFLHMTEHATFVGTGVLFWGTVMGRFGHIERLSRVGLVFATALQSAALGALLAFAAAPLYHSHLSTTQQHGLTPLEDQQLAGGIMWVPPGVVYIVVMIVLLARWFQSMDTDAAESVAGAREA
jgi:cytochrome c oxidase assembly factor CtaG